MFLLGTPLHLTEDDERGDEARDDDENLYPPAMNPLWYHVMWDGWEEKSVEDRYEPPS